jgi:hypothetical protein
MLTNIEVVERYSVELCRQNPSKIYVYGDNLAGYGTAGQACIRKEPNTYGVPTKRYPSMVEGSFFKDSSCEQEHVLKALRELYKLSAQHTLVFPKNGLGTGLSKMPEKSPLIYAEMCEILRKHFGFNNGEYHD